MHVNTKVYYGYHLEMNKTNIPGYYKDIFGINHMDLKRLLYENNGKNKCINIIKIL